MAALVVGQGDIPGQGTAAVPLLILGLALNRIVFMTGGAFTPRAAVLIEAGAHHVIAKPFRFPEVFDVIQRVIRRTGYD